MSVFHVRAPSPPAPVVWAKDVEDAAANTTLDEFPFGYSATARTLVSAILVPSGSETVTANDTNYAGFSLSVYAPDGTQTELGFLSTKTVAGGGTGSLTPWLPYAFTLIDTAVPAGGTFTLIQAKQGSGVKLPSLTIVLTFA